MKYTIEGFSQVESVRIGLDVKDLVLLRWIVDFYNTGCMSIHLFEGVPFFWINYQYVLRELPVLGISSKDVLARRMKRMAKIGLLEARVFESAGHRTYFRFKKAALRGLLSNTEAQGWLFDSNEGGSDSKVGRVPTQKSDSILPKSRKHVDSSINDSSINDKKKHFVPPTLDEVNAYCDGKNSPVDPEAFIAYYESTNWIRGKTQIRNWKACILTWERRSKHDLEFAPHSKDFINYNEIKSIAEKELGKIAKDDMIEDTMRKIPQKAWWIVDKYLKGRYPDGGGAAFGRAEVKLIREMKNA